MQFLGLRFLGENVTDAQEAGSLSHNRDNIDIYSNSWGPYDDGTTASGPETLTTRAFKEGSTEACFNFVIRWMNWDGRKDGSII